MTVGDDDTGRGKLYMQWAGGAFRKRGRPGRGQDWGCLCVRSERVALEGGLVSGQEVEVNSIMQGSLTKRLWLLCSDPCSVDGSSPFLDSLWRAQPHPSFTLLGLHSVTGEGQ